MPRDARPFFAWEELQQSMTGHWLVPPGPGDGIHGVSTDSRNCPAGSVFVALCGERFDGHGFVEAAVAAGAAAVVVSSAFPVELLGRLKERQAAVLRVADTLIAYQELGAAHRRRWPELKVVGVTGSCGKTSTKDMLAAVLEAHAPRQVLATVGNTNNLVGVPQNLLRLGPDHRFAVLELGTNSPGEIPRLAQLIDADIGLLTCIAPVHLEGLGDLAGVAAEKAAVFSSLSQRDGTAVLPSSCLSHPAVRAALPKQYVTVGSEADAMVRARHLGGDLAGSRFALHAAATTMDIAWGLHGRHQTLNGGLAAAAGRALEVPWETICQALRQCRPATMRMQVVRHADVCWINDAYNANPASMRALIDWLGDAAAEIPGRLFLALGDMLELGPNGPGLHLEVLRDARTRLPQAVLLPVGPLMSQAAAVLDVPAFTGAEAAASELRRRVRAGDAVALKGSRGVGLEAALPVTVQDALGGHG